MPEESTKSFLDPLSYLSLEIKKSPLLGEAQKALSKVQSAYIILEKYKYDFLKVQEEAVENVQKYKQTCADPELRYNVTFVEQVQEKA